MSGKSDGADSEDWSATEDSIGEVPFQFNTPRSITPKGPLFPNLGEAHQAITSRLVSNSAGSHIPDTPTDPSPVVSPFASSSSDINSVGNSLNNGARENSADSDPSGTGSTVEDIYDQYYTPPPMLESLSSAEVRQHRDGVAAALSSNYFQHSQASFRSVNSRSPAIQHANSGINLNKNYWQTNHQASELAQVPLPGLPRARRDTKLSATGSTGTVVNFSRPVLSLHSVSSQRDLAPVSDNGSQASGVKTTLARSDTSNRSNLVPSTASHVDPDFVIYGRLPPQHNHEKLGIQDCQEGDVSHGGVSNAGLSTDSDEDPFKYDRGSFTVFLQPSREREVSAALRCVSADSTASASGLLHLSSSDGPPTPRAVQSSNNPFVNKLQTYSAPAVQYDWDDEDDPNDVRISVRPPVAPPNSPVQPGLSLSEFVQGLGSQRRRKDINTLMSDGADWETVATSVGQFDSNRALASSMGLCGSHIVKVAGSSIADYSDTSSFHVPQFDAYSSTDRILQHTATDYNRGTPYGRTLEGTGRPVFLPKPRIHRVNGYLQNSHRMFTDPTTGSSGNSARSAFVEKLSASIRSRSARKRAQRRNQYSSEHWSKSRFESLESISSTYSERPGEMNGAQITESAHEIGATATGGNKDHGVVAINGREEQRGDKTNEGLLPSPIPREPSAAHLRSHHPTQSRQSRQSCGFASPTLFSFPLISLQEAAQQAALRADNDDDFTVTSGVRTRKNSSMVSSKATQRTTPPTPHITKPLSAYSRRPTSASILGIPEDYRGYSDSSQGMVLAGHDRGISILTSHRSGTPPVTNRSTLSRSFRNPFEPVGSSLRSSHPFPGPSSVFDSPPCLVTRDKRGGARAANMTTNLRHIAEMETGTPFAAQTDDAHLSWEARKSRQGYYYIMCMLCIFPFIAPLVYWGAFDSALSWYTRGETASLTARQRRNVLIIGIVISGLWLTVLVASVAVLVNTKQQHHHA
ncbi:hypothetical protein C8A00DRAFT_15489 [Chaetomidium leptoderma]|uniref:Uncharacterized protein n=1 Tax=Chaetomidium leptoderma TaxID=669021 RepID=A0AAN6VN02_9PEZI|nr:hypothetical protein C8A00DRAFT_15489 [Chaetomidium leptoderma]